MGLLINDGRSDQYLHLTGLNAATSHSLEIKLDPAGADITNSDQCFLLDQNNSSTTTGFRIYRLAETVYIFGPDYLQVSSSTVWSNALYPTTAEFNPLLIDRSIIKIRNIPAGVTDLFVFGTPDQVAAGCYAEIEYIYLKRAPNATIYANFDTTTPAAQYTNNGYTLDVINYATGDITPPDFNVQPSAGSATGSGHTITFTLNENCIVYGVMLAVGATAPSAAQVIAGTDGDDGAPVQWKNKAAVENASTTLIFDGGSASTTYNYFIAAVDTAGNPQGSAATVTAATNSGSISVATGEFVFGQAFTINYTGMASVDTPIVVGPDSQGNSLNVTVADQGGGVATGTFPSLPSSGSSSLILIEDGLTVTATEV